MRLSDTWRNWLEGIVKRFAGTSQQVRRGQVLFKADADGCRRRTGEKIRERRVTETFAATWQGKPRPLRASLLDDEHGAKVIAVRLGTPQLGDRNRRSIPLRCPPLYGVVVQTSLRTPPVVELAEAVPFSKGEEVDWLGINEGLQLLVPRVTYA